MQVSPIQIVTKVKEDVHKVCENGISSKIADKFIEQLVEKEVDRRTEALMKCYNEWERLSKEFEKVNRPDVLNYTTADSVEGEGSVVRSFSKEAWKKRGEILQKIDKVEKIIDDAITNVNYDRAFELKVGN